MDKVAERQHSTTRMQRVAAAVGVAFLLVGILGFVPGVTSDVDQMKFAGHESGAQLLGLFQVSVLHNIVHLLFGVAGLILARSWRGARAYLVGGGIIYLILWVYGLAIDQADDANFVPVNGADNWLHLGLGVTMVILGSILVDERRTRDNATAAHTSQNG